MKNRLFFIIIIIIFLLCPNHIHGQEVEYNSFEELLEDFNKRDFEKPIIFLNQQISDMEINADKANFPDSIYIGFASLLSTAYVHTNDIPSAERLIDHIVDFFYENEINPKGLYPLYLAYGGINYQLTNYDLARKYYDSALKMYLEDNNIKNEDYAILLSALAVTNCELGYINEAKEQIEDCIKIVKDSHSSNTLSNKIQIFQKAGAIFYNFNEFDQALEYTLLAYNLSRDNEGFITEHINTAYNLGSLYLNLGNYNEAINVLKKMETLPINKRELSNIYESLYSAYYYINDKENTARYASLCSRNIKEDIISFFSALPLSTTERFWNQQAYSLKANMGIMDLCGENENAVKMCYDNALFIKSLRYINSSLIREAISSNKILSSTFSEIKNLRSLIFSGNMSDFDISKKLTLLKQKEQGLINDIHASKEIDIKNNIKTWKDVLSNLEEGEAAIEYVTYAGFTEEGEPDKEMKYGALVLSKNVGYPIFVNLCNFNDLYDQELAALKNGEIGINELYKKSGNCKLYELIWDKIEQHLFNVRTVFISPTLGLQYINFNYIPFDENTYLKDKYNIRIVSSSSVISETKNDVISIHDISLFGGIDYGQSPNSKKADLRNWILEDVESLNRGGFRYLNGSMEEVDSIKDIMGEKRNAIINIYKGKDATEEAIREMDGNSPSLVHISTHGFYLVGSKNLSNYFSGLVAYSEIDNSLLYSGLLFAEANTAFESENRYLNDGVLTSEEISTMDFSNTELVVLSACETSLGSTTEGLGGLTKAFKLAGAKHIIASLWKVSDASTSMLMTEFYRQLLLGEGLHNALLKAQYYVSEYYPDPYYWAAFYVLD